MSANQSICTATEAAWRTGLAADADELLVIAGSLGAVRDDGLVDLSRFVTDERVESHPVEIVETGVL